MLLLILIILELMYLLLVQNEPRHWLLYLWDCLWSCDVHQRLLAGLLDAPRTLLSVEADFRL